MQVFLCYDVDISISSAYPDREFWEVVAMVTQRPVIKCIIHLRMLSLFCLFTVCLHKHTDVDNSHVHTSMQFFHARLTNWFFRWIYHICSSFPSFIHIPFTHQHQNSARTLLLFDRIGLLTLSAGKPLV